MSTPSTPGPGPSEQSGAYSASTDGHQGSPDAIVGALTQVSDRVQSLVREEVELAKAEIQIKAKKLITGTVVGIVAGIFVVVGLLFALHGLAWLIWYLFFPKDTFFWGFFIVAAILFLVGALAGFVASRAIKGGTPPAPTMAIDEAKRIKATMTSPEPETTIPVEARR